MIQELKIGDRVRVTSQRPVHGYQAGCAGIVRDGLTTYKHGNFYGVSMDKDESEDATLFLADEIEADAVPSASKRTGATGKPSGKKGKGKK